MVRSAALASIVEASTPIHTRTRPCSATSSIPSRTPSRGPHAEADPASSTTTSDREPSPGSPAAENPAANANRTPPGDAPLAGDPLEIADHVHAEVPTRRHRRRAHLRRVIRLACLLDKGIETTRDQHFLKPVVKHMARRARHLCPAHNQIALPIALPPHRHSANPAQSPASHGINETRLRQRAVKAMLRDGKSWTDEHSGRHTVPAICSKGPPPIGRTRSRPQPRTARWRAAPALTWHERWATPGPNEHSCLPLL